MTEFPDFRPGQTAAPRGLEGPGRAAVLWQGLWVLMVLAAAGVLLTVQGAIPFRVGLALTFGALPGVLGGVWGRGASRRPLMVIWAIGAGLAVVLAGGLSGPLLLWCALPLIVAAIVGARWREGVVLSFAILAAAALAQLAGWGPSAPTGADMVWTALLATAVMLGSVEAGLILFGRQRPDGLRDEARWREPVRREPARVVEAPLAPAPAQASPPLAESAPVPPPPVEPVRQLQPAAMSEERLRRIEQAEKGLRDQLRTTLAARAEAEAERDAALVDRDRAEANARARLRFLANMSHELRTPLNAIMGFSDIMRARLFGEMAPKYGEYAELIHESGGHVLDLINDLLDMAKIESDKYELRRELFDVREAINAALRILRVQADDAGVQLRGELPGEEVSVDADPRAIKQVVLNLVSNSLKFTPPGGSVVLTAGPRDGALEIVIADTGTGISAEDLARIGRPFEQAGDVKDRQRGTGLGLSLVKAFAALHGGELMIESVLGEGTVASVRLPVLATAEDIEARPGLHGRAD